MRTIIEMVNMTRAGLRPSARHGMRAAGAQPCTTRRTARRSALLIDQPLMRNVLADLAVESEAATRSRCGWPAPPTAPSAATRARPRSGGSRLPSASTGSASAARHAAEAMECLGGNGYVEDSGMPRLYRESPLNSIWEGSGNVTALDVLRALGRERNRWRRSSPRSTPPSVPTTARRRRRAAAH